MSTAVAVHSKIQELPSELLYRIVAEVNRDSRASAPLVGLLRVNKRWFHIIKTVLYKHIALSGNLDTFLSRFNATEYSMHIRPVTLRGDFFDIDHEADELVAFLRSLTKLQTFSLVTTEGDARYHPKLAVRMVEALPDCCTNLELVMVRGKLSREPNKAHLCDSIRRILPRMENLRIQMSQTCCEMFGKGGRDDFVPESLPRLKTLVLSSDPCSSECDPPWLLRKIRPKDKPTLNWGLEKLADRLRTDFPSHNASIISIMSTDYLRRQVDLAPGEYLTLIKADMFQEVSWAFPMYFLGLELSRKVPATLYSMRLLDGEELVSDARELASVVEGNVWCSLIGGTRLPTSLLTDEICDRVSLSTECIGMTFKFLKTITQLRKDKPEANHPLWTDEERVGIELLHAQKRQGPGYSDLKPISVKKSGELTESMSESL